MVTVRAPATSANLGSGFDVFGVALDRPADVVRVEPADSTSITVEGTGSQYIPENPADNTAGVVARELEVEARIQIDKGVRPASGIGSSAASAAAAALALNEAFDLGYSRAELVEIAAEGERAVSGDAHRDNVAPALLGGFTAATRDGVEHVDADLPLVACLPETVVSTGDAREVVPGSAPMEEVVATVGAATTLVLGMVRDDPTMVGRGMYENLVTPARAELIDGYHAVCEAALEAGAAGVTVSGAGPALLAVCYPGVRRRVAGAMVEAFHVEGVEARAYQTRIGNGATVYR